jgi:Fe-Mn family superoxide dismutase
MPFALPDLPYPQDALLPYVSAETLTFHHGKHHRTYVETTNKLVTEKDLTGLSLVEVIRQAKERGETKLFNQSAQVWNHSFFWQCLAPASATRPAGQLAELMDEAFGSVDKFIHAFKKEATDHFASGYAWLVLEGDTLKVQGFHDADTPVAQPGVIPLLALDVWEHSYYIDYRNVRKDFVAAVVDNLINWEFVARNLDGKGTSRADQSWDGSVLKPVSSLEDPGHERQANQEKAESHG